VVAASTAATPGECVQLEQTNGEPARIATGLTGSPTLATGRQAPVPIRVVVPSNWRSGE